MTRAPARCGARPARASGWGAWGLALASACLSPALAQPADTPAPPAAAASAPMSIVGEWRGPFPDTKVLKLLDAQDGVACYFYVPSNVPSSTVCKSQDDCAIHYPSGIGTMSCVKVTERVAPSASQTTKAPKAPKR